MLAVLCLSAFVTVLDAGTIVNVALPSLSIDLGATTRQLQWIVDAYLLVFTGLLLAAGSVGDRWGRKRALLVGLAVFGATSAFAGSVDSAGALIGGRALMGVGAALIYPATLAIITATFTDALERAKAIGIWAAVSGMAVAFGPITGGWLLEHFWWGSVFFVNLPVVAGAIALTAWLVPESSDRETPPLDKLGFALSIAGITALVFAIIEAPEWGWLDGQTIGTFGLAAGLLAAFVAWELHVDEPMLPVRIFENLRFSAASAAVTSAFFALFGFVFLVTQYFQFVRGYRPLEAGLRTIPVAVAIALASIVAPMLVERVGTKRVVAAGLMSMSAAFLWISTVAVGTDYLVIVGQMILLGAGLGATTAPATESIMGSLSVDKAGVGSAVNDTTRELGGTLGVAILGSVFNSLYSAGIESGTAVAQLPVAAQEAVKESIGAARFVANDLGAAAPAFMTDVNSAFIDGMAMACYLAAGVTLAGAMFVLRFLPARSGEAAASETAGRAEPAHMVAEPA
ncbi:MAG: DHA2 family efflux MFS transporter permease subunit [Acidimicrobiales bacterium]